MSTPRALVITGPGTNRDPDCALALRRAGAAVTLASAHQLRTSPEVIEGADIAVVAGGFSYADALGAGRVLAVELTRGLGERLGVFVERGGLLLGICNGFQVLTRAGLLPGALGHNAGGHFLCDWVELAPEPSSHCVWTRGLADPIHCPIAHGEGRYVHDDPDALHAAGQVALRYASPNPNGSVADIAGVCDTTGRILGLMPHPENHVLDRQHPRRRHVTPGRHLGLALFVNAVEAVRGR